MRNILAIYFFFVSVISFAQGIVTKQYTIDNGLIANDVRALCVDSKGVLWIGSRSGLAQKIQGNVKPNEDAAEYRYTNISDILEDAEGNMWIGSYGQGVLFRGKEEKRIITKKDGLLSDRIRKIFSYKNVIYVATSEGVSVIHKNSFKIVNPSFEKSLQHPFEVSGFFEFDGIIYLTTINDGVFTINNNKLIKVDDQRRIFAVHQKDGLVFYGCQTGLFVKDFKKKQLVAQIEIPSIRDIQEVNNQVYFVSANVYESGGGVFRWDGESLEEITKVFGIDATDLYSISLDEKNDFLYLGTKSQGLFQVDLFSPLMHNSSVGHVMALGELDRRVFIFSEEGLIITQDDKEIKKVALSVFKSYQEQHYKKYSDIATISNHFFEIDYNLKAENIVFYKAVKNKNDLWVSTNIGIYKLDRNGYIMSYYPIHTYEYGFYKNNLVETNPYGGVRIYRNLDKMDYDYHFRIESINIPRDVIDIAHTTNKMFFAGALDGLYVYEDGKFTSLKGNGLFAESRLKELAVGDNDVLYVATDFNDIYGLETKSGQYEVVKFIPNSEINGSSINLLEFADKKLFIGTNRGLTVIENDNKFFFNKEQGFGRGEITSDLLLGNLLYIGSGKGLSTLDVSYFKKKNISLQVSISKIVINGVEKSKEGKPYYDIKMLELKANQNNLQIGFDVLGAKFPDKLHFQYRLKPSENWVNVKSNRLDLHYLQSGIYPIDIKIYDYDSGSELIYPLLLLDIQAPFYTKLWFYIVATLVVIGIFYLIYKARLVQIQKEEAVKRKKYEYEKRLAEVKLMSVRSQFNSHFIFNVLSSIQYYILKEEVDDALYYLDCFAKLIRKTLTISSKERITLKEECEYLKDYVLIENMRLDGRVTFSVEEVDEGVSAILLPPMLLQPFVENSLIHAFPKSVESPQIRIVITKQNKDVIINIIDNGIGIASQSKSTHESHGMNIVRERMSLIQEYLDEDLTVERTTEGTVVKLILKGVII